MNQLESKINYYFKNKEILNIALTHSSYSNEAKGNLKNNERLEFLGDSVISLIVANHLFEIFPKEAEGELTKVRAFFVCDNSLAKFAEKINLGEHLKIGKGEEQAGGRKRPSILEDAFEALVGAIYLDGGFDIAKNFVLGFLPKQIDIKKIESLTDYKTKLQEIVQKQKKNLNVEYVLAKESGPDHDKCFKINLNINKKTIGSGSGKSKKRAEQDAAKNALENLKDTAIKEFLSDSNDSFNQN